jgi:hypothetical protein
MIGAIAISETSVSFYQTTLRNIPENSHLDIRKDPDKLKHGFQQQSDFVNQPNNDTDPVLFTSEALVGRETFCMRNNRKLCAVVTNFLLLTLLKIRRQLETLSPIIPLRSKLQSYPFPFRFSNKFSSQLAVTPSNPLLPPPLDSPRIKSA